MAKRARFMLPRSRRRSSSLDANAGQAPVRARFKRSDHRLARNTATMPSTANIPHAVATQPVWKYAAANPPAAKRSMPQRWSQRVRDANARD